MVQICFFGLGLIVNSQDLFNQQQYFLFEFYCKSCCCLLVFRFGQGEKGRRVVTTCLLLSKASGQLQMVKKITFQLHSVLLAMQQQTGCKSLKRNTVLIMQKFFLFLCCVFVCVCVCQPLWKLNLMMGVNTTKQQMGEIKNTI